MWTYWKCEACGAQRRVRHTAGTPIPDVVALLRRDHERVSDATPPCAFDVWKVRIASSPFPPPARPEARPD